MTGVHVLAVLSLALPVPAAVALADRALGRQPAALSVLFGGVAYAALVLLPLHVEAALELGGAIDRMVLAGPAVASAAVLVPLWLSGGRLGARRVRDVAARLRSSLAGLPRPVLAALALVSLVYAFFALERLVGYPRTWDSVSYHLPMAARWLADGSLAVGPDANFYEAVPWNGDLFGLLALATGWPALAEAWNVLSLTLLLSASYLLCRAIGVARRGALVTALLVAALPIVLFQTFSAYVDLFVAAGLLGGLAAGALLYTGDVTGDDREPVLWIGALSLGLAVGTKPTAWPVALLVAAAIVAWLCVRGPALGSGGGRLLAGFAGAAAAPALFWLVRNGVATGNPFFPLEIKLFGLRIFAGTTPTQVTYGTDEVRFLTYALDWLAVPWTDGRGSAGYPYSVGSGLGPLFAAFVVPGVPYLCWKLARRDAPGGAEASRRRLRAVLVGSLVVFAFVWWFVLTPVWRFGLAGLVVACVLAGPFVEGFSARLPRLFGTVLLAAVLVFAAAATAPRAADLAHQVHHGEWTWSEYYHLPDEFVRVPGDATVVNWDPGPEGWNNFALLGPGLTRRVVPDWKVEAALAQGDPPWICGSYIVDRAPFRIEAGAERRDGARLRLLAETGARHGDAAWRIWRVEGGDCTPVRDRSGG